MGRRPSEQRTRLAAFRAHSRRSWNVGSKIKAHVKQSVGEMGRRVMPCFRLSVVCVIGRLEASKVSVSVVEVVVGCC